MRPGVSSHSRPSRSCQDGDLGAGTVKARRPRESAVGAKRRALDGAEHRSSIDRGWPVARRGSDRRHLECADLVIVFGARTTGIDDNIWAPESRPERVAVRGEIFPHEQARSSGQSGCGLSATSRRFAVDHWAWNTDTPTTDTGHCHDSYSDRDIGSGRQRAPSPWRGVAAVSTERLRAESLEATAGMSCARIIDV